MIRWISESTTEHVSPCPQRPSVHSKIVHYCRRFYSSLFYELKQCHFTQKKKKAKKWKAAFFMTSPIYSPVDFRKHNFPNSCSQGREPLTQQKLQWIPWCHTWPCNWLTCIWVSGAQVNEKLYLKKLHHQMEDPYIQALHELDCKWDLYLWSISTVVFLMTI